MNKDLAAKVADAKFPGTAMYTMKLLQFSEKSIQEGKVYDNDQVFSELRKNIDRKNS